MPTSQLVAAPMQADERLRQNPSTAKPSKLSAPQTRLLSLLIERPGMTIRELTTPMGATHATVTYHLGVLVRKGMLVRERDGRDVRHYIPHRGRANQYIEAMYREPRKRAILLLLAERSASVSVNAMAKQLQVPFGFLKRTLVALDRQGFVRLETKAFRFTVHVQPTLRSFLRNHEVSIHPGNGFDVLTGPMP